MLTGAAESNRALALLRAGRAARLDPAAFRGARPAPTLDEAVYASNLDLSRPLPPDWQFTSSARSPVTGSGS